MKSAREDELAGEIAEVVGLTERTVERRLGEAHGRTLVRNLFEDRWPREAADFEGRTAAWARSSETTWRASHAAVRHSTIWTRSPPPLWVNGAFGVRAALCATTAAAAPTIVPELR